jgi:hypothetical protein
MAKTLMMQDEMLKELLQEVRRELDQIVRSHRFSVRVVRACVASEIELLIEDRFIGAVEARSFAYRALCQAKTQVDPETFHEALCALDLGSFASDLWVRFGHFCVWKAEDMIYQVWHARKDFLPNLADVFRVVAGFVGRMKRGQSPGIAFYYDLKSPNDMFAIFGESCVYGDKPIGHILSATAMKKLKELLRGYVRGRSLGAGG